jgi:hypothetical protein
MSRTCVSVGGLNVLFHLLFLDESRLQDPKSYTGIHKRNNVNALCALHEAPSSSVKPPPTHQHTSAKVRLRLCIRHVSVSVCPWLWRRGSVGQSEHDMLRVGDSCRHDQTPRGRLFAETPGR